MLCGGCEQARPQTSHQGCSCRIWLTSNLFSSLQSEQFLSNAILAIALDFKSMLKMLKIPLWPRIEGQVLLQGFQPLQHLALANLSCLTSKPTPTLAPFSFPPPPPFPTAGNPSMKNALPRRPPIFQISHPSGNIFFLIPRSPLLFFLSKPCFSQTDEDPPTVTGPKVSCNLCEVTDCVCFMLDPGPRRVGFVQV